MPANVLAARTLTADFVGCLSPRGPREGRGEDEIGPRWV